MSETEGLEVYASGRISPMDREETIARVQKTVRAENDSEFMYLCKVGKPEDETRASAIDAICSIEIKRFHEEAGISLEKEQIPMVFVVPDHEWKEVTTHFNKPSNAAGFATHDSQTVVVKEHENTLFMAATTIHEMTHAVGRSATVVTPGKYGDRIHGYTTHTGDGNEDSIRGEALEEGVAEYIALKLVLNSTHSRIQEAREETAREMGSGNLEDLNKTGKNFLVKLDHQARTPRQYIYAETLVETLVNDGGEEMESLLLSARIDTKKRGQLVHEINTIYQSNEAARRIFQTPFESEDIQETVIWLKQQTALNKIKNTTETSNG